MNKKPIYFTKSGNARFYEKKYLLNPVIEILVIIGLLSSLVVPSVSMGGMSTYLTTLISPVIFLLVISGWAVSKTTIHKSLVIVLSMTAMVLITSLLSWSKSLSPVSLRDINESVKYAQYVPYMMAIPFIKKERFSKGLQCGLYVSAVVFLLIGLVQVFQVSILFDSIGTIYLAENSTHLKGLLSGKRLSFTGSDPNIGGFIAAFFAIYILIESLYKKKYVYLIVFFVFVFFVLKSQSRTVLLALALSASFFFLFFYETKINNKILLLVSLFSCVAILASYIDLDYVLIGFQLAMDGGNNSLNVRFENISLAYERFLVSPIFGWGPAKGVFSTVIDSEYALIMQRYGLMGFCIFSGLYFVLFKYAVKNLFLVPGATLFIVTLMSLVTMGTNNVFSGYQLMSIPILLLIWNIVLMRD